MGMMHVRYVSQKYRTDDPLIEKQWGMDGGGKADA